MTNRAELKRASAKTPWPAILFILVSIAALALASSAQSTSPPPEPLPPAEIRLGAEDHGRAVQLREGEELVISLEANPSTGYAWQVDQGPLAAQSQSILVQTGEAFETPQAQGSTDVEPSAKMPLMLGAPEIQILRFQAAQAGQTTLRLVYRRPWEEDVAPAEEFSVSVEAIGPFTQPLPRPMVSAPQPTGPPSVDLGEVELLGLPAAFNWCDQGACSPVRNQGGCGSCWAFSTAGVLESNLLIYDSLEKDLSEQYLLSCNTDGWDCEGGFFAHDYHQWKIPPIEPKAGAVYEADSPYTGEEDPCYPPHTHHEKIVDWEYVGGPGGVPPVANIKQAIMDHGPVSAAVCVGTVFGSYGGGVFQTNEACPHTVNHAVVLVGWDDNQAGGIWYLRNSWGPSWGESGYMRIRYGTSMVGYAANYVIYDPTCYDLDTQVYPVGAGTVVANTLPECEGSRYEPGTDVELQAQANPGWHFFTWGGDVSGSDNPTTITMDSDKSVAAHFMCNDCTPRAHFPLGMRDY